VTDNHDVLVRVLRVFTDEAGREGNALGVIDGALVVEDDRQRVARELGFSETVFIENYATGELRIFTPAVEIPSAGHPLVGAAWLLLHEPEAPPALELRPPGGLVRAWTDTNDRTWIEAPLDTTPDWTLVQLGSPAAVEDLVGPLRQDHDLVVYWAWLETGVMRMRCFAPRIGIAEDEAAGSAALMLAALVEMPIEIHQGRGSLLFARPVDAERAEVGGLVVEDEPLHVEARSSG
jgi:predicted PhzF superfamily epimerase YddE/YHI9